MTVILTFTSCKSNSDWPGWRGADRDGKVIGFEVPAEWPTSLNQNWQTTVGEADASPILIKNKLYLHTKIDSMETAFCIDSKTGVVIWKTEINPAPEVSGGGRTHPGPRSTPSYIDGKLITLGADGILTCIDTKDGDIIWKNTSYTFEFPKFYTSVSPLLLNNMCVVHLGGHENGAIVAFEINSGEEIWKIVGEPCTYSSPVIWDTKPEQILVQTESDLLGISLEGTILWRIPTPGERMFYNSATPLYEGNTHFISGQGLGTTAYSVLPENGKYAVKELWKNPDYGVTFCTPVIKDGYLYTNDTRFGYLTALNTTSGELAWADTVKWDRFASVYDLGEVMASLPATGDLIFFEPNTHEYHELARYKVSETKVYASAVFTGNTIFTKDEKTLSSWSLK